MTRIRLVVLVRRIALTALVAWLIALATIDPFTLLNTAASAGIGAYLIDRRPRNPIGLLLLAISVLGLGTTGRPDHDVAALAFVPAIAPAIELAVSEEVGTIWVPNVLSPLGADASFRPPPIGVVLVTLIPISAMALGAADLLRRYRRGPLIERLQIRWLLASIAALVLAILFGLAVFVLAGPGSSWGWLPALLAGPTLAPAIGIAVLRYRLYEIDRIISRTLSWAIVTSVLVAVFAGLVVGLQAALAGITQGQTLAVAASTLVAFALFQPVRRRVQRAVDRRFDRARYDRERTAAAFADRLRTEVDLEAVAGDLTRSVDGALRPRSLVLWLKDGAE